MSESENKPKATFDFSKVNRQWHSEFTRSLTQAARVQVILQRQPNDDMDDAEVDALFDRQEQALNDVEALADKQAELLTQVLVDVPVDWLLPNAPDGLDWSQVTSLDFIQADKYAVILDSLRNQNIASDDAKNSDGHSRSRQKRRGR